VQVGEHTFFQIEGMIPSGKKIGVYYDLIFLENSLYSSGFSRLNYN
jgi:hypothetical protein